MSMYTDGTLEPVVNTGNIPKADALFSIAVSMKRIADRLDMAFGENTLESNRREFRELMQSIEMSLRSS